MLNVICVTRNADLDTTETSDEADDDYREHMKRILKKRSRLAPVRLECETPALLGHEQVPAEQAGAGRAPGLRDLRAAGHGLRMGPRRPRGQGDARRAHEQALRAAVARLPGAQPLRPASRSPRRKCCCPTRTRAWTRSCSCCARPPSDPSVVSIKITLYRLASQSHLAEALINAAENGKEVTALFELRARFDESNNIEWSQRFEEAGCNVIYGFREYKVHSKICCITRQTEDRACSTSRSSAPATTTRRRRACTRTSRSSRPARPSAGTPRMLLPQHAA